MPKAKGNQYTKSALYPRETEHETKSEALAKTNITRKQASQYELMASHPDVAVRAEIRAIEKVGLAKEVREQKLHEAQLISEAVLDAESAYKVRIGQLMQSVPKASGGDRRSEDFKIPTVGSFEKTKKKVIEESGFSKTQVQRFEELASHPEIVEQAKAESRMLNFFHGVSSLFSVHGRSSLHTHFIFSEAFRKTQNCACTIRNFIKH